MSDSTSVDLHVGRKLKDKRKQLGLTPDALARSIAIDTETYRDMEAGQTRIGAPKLYALAQQLGVSIVFFFEATKDMRQ